MACDQTRISKGHAKRPARPKFTALRHFQAMSNILFAQDLGVLARKLSSPLQDSVGSQPVGMDDAVFGAWASAASFRRAASRGSARGTGEQQDPAQDRSQA